MTRYLALPDARTEMADVLSARMLSFLSRKHQDYLAAIAELSRMVRA